MIPLRLFGWLAAVTVLCALVGYWGVTYTETTTTATPSSCEQEGPAATRLATQAGTVVRALSTDTPPAERIAKDARGTLDVLGTWWAAFDAAMSGEPPPERVTRYEARVVSVQLAAQAACAPPAAAACAPSGSGAPGAAVAREAAAAAGFTGEDLTIAVAVAGAESSYDPSAAGGPNRNGSMDYGLWQINSVHADLLNGGSWSDPADNARMAYAVWERAGRSWSPWVTYKTGAYRDHLAAPPAECVIPASAAPAPFPNGQAPPGALCPTSRGDQLRCDAVASFDALAAAYAAAFGAPLVLTDGYRPLDAQVRLRAVKPHLAAVPGTSNHGYGVAVDLGGGVERFGTRQHEWMRANAPAYGWHLPAWAQQGGSKPEPWHWEFGTADGPMRAG